MKGTAPPDSFRLETVGRSASVEGHTLMCAACGRRTDTVPCTHCGNNPLLQGRYRLLDVISASNTATRYAASDVRLGGTAVHVTVASLRPDAVYLVRQWLPRWMESVRAARHRTIWGWHDAFLLGENTTGSLAIVQVPCTWPTLETSEAMPWTPQQTRAWMERCLDGLALLHGAETPISCGPLTRARVALSPEGFPVILHPGDTEQYASEPPIEPVIPPELRTASWTPSADIYRVAVLAVCLLTGRSTVQLRSTTGEPHWHKFLGGTSALETLLLRWLSDDSAERPTTAVAALSQLRQMGHPAPVLAAEPARGESEDVPVGVAAVRIPTRSDAVVSTPAPSVASPRPREHRRRLKPVDHVPSQPNGTGVPARRLRWLIVPILLALLVAGVLSLQIALTATGWLPGKPLISLQSGGATSP